MSSVVPADPGPVNYTSDPVPSDMASNFRNYMSHLSQLSPDHDNTQTTLFECHGGVTRLRPGNEHWVNNVEMCSSESEDEDCPMACDYPHSHTRIAHRNGAISQHTDQHTDSECEIHRSHSRRNPRFPYESIGTPRVAWGETPREAWREHPEDPLYDPYALFNLPKSNQRVKRKQKSQMCTCQSLSGEQELDRVVDPRYATRENHRPAICERHRTSNSVISPADPGYEAADVYVVSSSTSRMSPQPSTSSDIVGHTSQGRKMLGTSKSLPIFSSQESMDTNSEAGESSDTDVDIVSVNRASGRTCMGCASNGLCSGCGNHDLSASRVKSSVCKHHSAQSQNASVIRPKAIKLESGQKYPTCEPQPLISPCSARERTTTGMQIGNSVLKKPSSGTKSCIRKTNEPETFPCSETRVLQMPSAEGVIENTQSNVIRENHSFLNATQKSQTNSKSLKDLHNSVIRERFFKHPQGCINSEVSCSADIETGSSIDLTAADSDENGSSDPTGSIAPSNERPSAISPVISEVQLPSFSDDSDIEVVKIETNRLILTMFSALSYRFSNINYYNLWLF